MEGRTTLAHGDAHACTCHNPTQPNIQVSRQRIHIVGIKIDTDDMQKFTVSNALGISHDYPPQALCSTKNSPARHRISSLPTLPSTFSTPLFLTPTLVFHFFSVIIPPEPSCPFHESGLALMIAFHPAVYAGVAVYEACW